MSVERVNRAFVAQELSDQPETARESSHVQGCYPRERGDVVERGEVRPRPDPLIL